MAEGQKNAGPALWSKLSPAGTACISTSRGLAPAMRYVGSLWEQNLITVANEHLASCVCDILLTRYAGLVKPDVIETPSLGDAGFFFITGTWMT
ncbi:B12-binding domain-containing protein [Paenibacillus sp. Y412MC10]|uniref:B12-binding domain-containing protein n=1 Tax=Geobacillus sp. (strain Y412MC10) TaxID=481743 RepID=UPI0037C8ACC3